VKYITHENIKSPWPGETLTLAYSSPSLGTLVRSATSRIAHGNSGSSGEYTGAVGGRGGGGATVGAQYCGRGDEGGDTEYYIARWKASSSERHGGMTLTVYWGIDNCVDISDMRMPSLDTLQTYL
jgi:hypothetical protein